MMYTTADILCKSILMNRGYSIHWYLPVLKYLADGLGELALDDLKISNSVLLKLNSYNAAPIPNDFLDYIRIGIQNGEYVKPMTQNDGYNRMYNYDPHGNPQPWPAQAEGAMDLAVYGVPYLSYYVNSYNARGENVGGLYGFRTDGAPFTFDIIAERNEIQFDSALGATKVVMDYLSDGRTVSAASKILIYAENTLRDYCYWQLDEHKRNISGGEKERKYNKYVGSRVVLRGRMNDLTNNDYINIYRNSYNAAPK